MNVKTTNKWFELLVQIGPDAYDEAEKQFQAGGYSAFYELLEGLREKITAADEEGLDELRNLVEKGREIIPEPGAISPSWEQVWNEYDAFIRYKDQALQAVPREERVGEWQIVMDNPYSSEGVACYPGLSFLEAAYLYSYFRNDLKKAEYLRLQKVVNLIVVDGGA